MHTCDTITTRHPFQDGCNHARSRTRLPKNRSRGGLTDPFRALTDTDGSASEAKAAGTPGAGPVSQAAGPLPTCLPSFPMPSSFRGGEIHMTFRTSKFLYKLQATAQKHTAESSGTYCAAPDAERSPRRPAPAQVPQTQGLPLLEAPGLWGTEVSEEGGGLGGVVH